MLILEALRRMVTEPMRVAVCISNMTNRVVAQAVLEKHGYATYGCDVSGFESLLKDVDPHIIFLEAPKDRKSLLAVQDISALGPDGPVHLVTLGAEQSCLHDQIIATLKPVANISRPFDMEGALKILALLSHDPVAHPI